MFWLVLFASLRIFIRGRTPSFVCEDEHVYVADFMNTANVRRILGDKWENY